MKKIILALVSIIAFFWVLGIAGHYDMCSEIAYNLNDEIYDEIARKIGTRNDIKVAEYYLENIEDYE